VPHGPIVDVSEKTGDVAMSSQTEGSSHGVASWSALEHA